MPKLGVMGSSPLLAGIQPEQRDAMFACLAAREIPFVKGSYVLREGDAVDSIGFVKTGLVHVVREDFWGNRNLITEIAAGEVFAESYACLPGSELPVSVVAVENTTVLFLDVRRVLTTCSTACEYHQVLIRNLVSMLAAKNLTLNEKLQHITQRSTREKLLSYLSSQSRRVGNASFTIPFNRQELADYLSVDRSAMSVELGRMRQEGLLHYQKNQFTLLA